MSDLRSNISELMRLAGCDAGAIRWLGEPKKYKCNPIVNLSIRDFQGFGVDETRYADASPSVAGKELTVTSIGSRTFALSIQVDSQTVSGEGSSWDVAESIRNRLYLPSVLEKMPGFCIALLSVGTLTTVEISEGHRYSSRTSFDVQFATTAITSDCPITFVETVDITVESGDATFPDIDLEVTL